MTRPVLVEKLKWDGSVSARWPASLLVDEPGRLVWRTEEGTFRERPRRGEREVVDRHEAAGAGRRWWVVTAWADEVGRVRYRVDAATPAERRDEGVVAFVDLDLDLALGGEEPVLEDREQFALRAREMGYPAEVQRGAWRGLADAAWRWRARRWPFDGSLAEVLAVGAAVRR
jgi:hypothetical protein